MMLTKVLKSDPWPAIVRRLDPDLLRVPPPASYHVGRRHGHAGLPDNVLLFMRQDLRTDQAGTHHHRHVLILALAGSGGVCVDRHIHRLRPGRAVLILPHQLHHYVDTQPPLRWLFVTFEAEAAAWTRLYNRQAAMHPDQEGLLLRLLRGFAEARPAGAERLALATALLLGELADRRLRPPGSGPTQPETARPDVLEQVNRILYRRLDRPPGIRGLAAEIGISPSHLRNLVRRSLGLSLGRYVLRVRLNHARILLADRRLRVGEVARQCGFGSLQAFSRAYRRMHGRSPRRDRG